jgi:RNA polymerase sigma-70 factor, ECF subfamily
MARQDPSAPDIDRSVEHDDTATLIEELRSGSSAAFAAVYAAERAPVYAFLVRLAGDTNVAADLFQNVWLKLARHAPRLRPDSNLRAWLLTVARREFISYRRAQALDLSRLLTLDRSAALPHEADARLSELAAALAKLTDREREVLLLISVEGLDAGRAADALGISAEALRQRLSRARKRLSALVEELAAEPGNLHAKVGSG